MSRRRPVVWTRESLEQATPGRWLNPPQDDWEVRGLSMWRWIVSRGDLYVSTIPSIRRAGRDEGHVPEAARRGASGAIVGRPITPPSVDFPLYLVDSPDRAIRDLARVARERFEGRVVTITGTVGKSTTVAMLRHVLSGNGHVVSTVRNRNYHREMPVFLGATAASADYCVLEVTGESLRSERRHPSLLARPHVAAITQIGDNHARLPRSHEETAALKSSIFRGLQDGGLALLNRGMPGFDIAHRRALELGHPTPISYGLHRDARVRPTRCSLEETSSRVEAEILGHLVQLRVPVPGAGMVENSLAAMLIAGFLGVDPGDAAERISTYKTERARLQRVYEPLADGTVAIIDDSWNATVPSMIEALRVLEQTTPPGHGRRVAVLGRIARLGDRSEQLHRSLAPHVLASNAELVFTHGEDMLALREALPNEILMDHCSTADQLAEALTSHLKPDDVLLFKGSKRKSDFYRSARMVRQRLRESAMTRSRQP